MFRQIFVICISWLISVNCEYSSSNAASSGNSAYVYYQQQPQYYHQQQQPQQQYYQPQQYYQQQPQQHYQQTQEHSPVIQNGVPVETPEVQAAKAAHFEAVAKARALAAKVSTTDDRDYDDEYQHQNNIIPYGPTKVIYTNNYQQQGQYQDNSHYQTTIGNYGSHNSGPVDTPEVQQAKAAHFAAIAQAKSQQQQQQYRIKREIYDNYYQPINQFSKIQNYYSDNGIHGSLPQPPIDTPEVQIAKQQHLLAHAIVRNGGLTPEQQQAPIDTPEVQLAKAQHFAAHAKEVAKQNQLKYSTNYYNYYH